MHLRSITEVDLFEKRVLLRVDFNVPIRHGQVVDDLRIKAVLPTIQYLKKRRAKIILISHLGDPKRTNHKNTLKPIAKCLECPLVSDYQKALQIIAQMKPGKMILLENLRFHPGEKKNDPVFARQLARLADVYINDAFSVSHREHASVSAITKLLPGYAGLRLLDEVKSLSRVLAANQHPLVIMIGGLKAETKFKIIQLLQRRADWFLLSSIIRNTFFKVLGYPIGQSDYEPNIIPLVKKNLTLRKFILPVDVKIKTDNKAKVVEIGDLSQWKKKNFEILDIGPKTINLFADYLKSAKMIVWNGPVGQFNDPRFALGTNALAKTIAQNHRAWVVIGGGSTIRAIKKHRLSKKVLISTGGGAMLDFLTGRILPGLRPLLKH